MAPLLVILGMLVAVIGAPIALFGVYRVELRAARAPRGALPAARVEGAGAALTRSGWTARRHRDALRAGVTRGLLPAWSIGLVLLLLGTLASCSRDRGLSAEACAERAAAVETALTATDTGVQHVRAAVPLVERTDGEPVDRTLPTLELDGAVQHLDLVAVRPGELRLNLDRLRAQLTAVEGLPDAPPPGRYYLAVSPTTPWSEVEAALATAAAAGFNAPRLVFARPAAPAAPRTWVTDEVDALRAAHCRKDDRGLERCDGDAMVKGFVAISERAARPCPQLAQLFAAPDEAPPDRAAAMIPQLAPALRACGCKVDPAVVHSLLDGLLRNPKPVSQHAVQLAVPGEGTPLAVAPTTPWSEASAALLAHGAPLALPGR